MNEDNNIQEAELSGTVIRKKLSRGSKSERDAILLKCGRKEYVLRRLGGNPFRDDSLESLVGKTVTATGMLDRNLFLVKEIREK